MSDRCQCVEATQVERDEEKERLLLGWLSNQTTATTGDQYTVRALLFRTDIETSTGCGGHLIVISAGGYRTVFEMLRVPRWQGLRALCGTGYDRALAGKGPYSYFHLWL